MKRCKVAYYRIDLKLLSALSVGAAQNKQTDCDVVLDSRGLPLIPATSIAGSLRSFFSPEDAQDEDALDEAERYFGKRLKRLASKKESEEAGTEPTDGKTKSKKDGTDSWADPLTESVVRVYDATWTGGNSCISTRDNVALRKDDKVAEDSLKFDRQIVEAGAEFRTYVEITDTGECPTAAMEQALRALGNGRLALGGKTTRGMGRVKITQCKRREFDLSNRGRGKDGVTCAAGDEDSDFAAWLRFRMFEDSSWAKDGDDAAWSIDDELAKGDDGANANEIVITLGLKQRGGISIRTYATAPDGPNFTQLYVRDSAKTDGAGDGSAANADNTSHSPTPVIPGTSWAGAFRSHYRRLAKAGSDSPKASPDVPGGGLSLEDELFGYTDKVEVGQPEDAEGTERPPKKWKTIQRRSRIEFGESEIVGGTWKDITRNSIDRFTGGTVDQALFTMRTYFGGSTSLVIRVRRDGQWGTEKWCRLLRPLVMSLADLHNGFLSVGGLTAVGHGLFKITKATCKVGNKSYEDFGELLMRTSDCDPYLILPDVEGIVDHLAKEVADVR